MSTELARKGSTVASAMTAHVDAIDGLLGLLERLKVVGVIPDKMTMAQATMACMAGARFGMDPITSMNSFYIVNNRATMAASAMQAVCLAHPDCEYFMLVESSAERATYEAKRRSAPRSVSISYTVADAKTAGLWGKGTWRAHPAQMLVARASSRLARAVFPDALHGMYTREELTNGEAIDDGDIIDAPYTPTPQRPASVKPAQVEHDAPADIRVELIDFINAGDMADAVELYWAARSPDSAAHVDVDSIRNWKPDDARKFGDMLNSVLAAGRAGIRADMARALGRDATDDELAALMARVERAADDAASQSSKVTACALLARRCVEKPETIHLRLGLPKVAEKGGEA